MPSTVQTTNGVVAVSRSSKRNVTHCCYLGYINSLRLASQNRNKMDYERVVVSLFEKRAIDVKFKAYQLNRDYKFSALKQQNYKDVGINVFHFGFMAPGAKFKTIKFGSDNYEQMEKLHQHVLKFGSLK